jgi:hypothetical protein
MTRQVKTRRIVLAGLVPIAIVLLTQLQASAAALTRPSGSSALPGTTGQRALQGYGRLPLAFVPNRGQTDARVRFSAQAGGASFWFTPREAVIAFAKEKRAVNLRLRFVGADPAAAVTGATPRPGKVTYLLGNDPSKWHSGLPTFGEVVYRDLWPGIDLAFRGQQGRLKYEFRVAPGADPATIRLAYRGAKRLALGRAGELRIQTALGVVRDSKPVSYQLVGGSRVRVASHYGLDAETYGFALGRYDRSRPLVIDPGLVYSTYLGGGRDDDGRDIKVDALGNAYVTGVTESANFPTTAGAFAAGANGSLDAYVAKLNPAGSALAYSTYLGGSDEDRGLGIEVDALGNAYVTGDTYSQDFPTTAGAFDTGANGSLDAFVTKLNPAGSALAYSTYLGGSLQDRGFGIAIDGLGNAYVTGSTGSLDFPTTAGAFDTGANGSLDAFVTKLNPAGSALAYSTYVGGSADDVGNGISLDLAGTAYVTGATSSADFPTTIFAFDGSANGGSDAFVTDLNATGSALAYSTYLGGSLDDDGRDIVADGLLHAYVTGFTTSANFPTTAGAFDESANGGLDAFVTKLHTTCCALAYSTYLGGSGSDAGAAVAGDSDGNTYVTGSTGSADFPTTAGALDESANGGLDAFVSKLDLPGFNLTYATYLGGSDDDFGSGIAVVGLGNVYLTGFTRSAAFPTTAGAVDTSFNSLADAFVTELAAIGAPATLVLSPAADTNTVGTSHTVTATVRDTAGQPVPSVVVRFTVTGSVSTSAQCTSDASGQCSASYAGPSLPGADLITAYADSDGDSVQDAGEPAAVATKAWLLPTSTPGQASGGGHIEVGGNRIAFGFNARSGAGGFQGSCNVIDQTNNVMVRCTDVTALVISGNAATVFGHATVNGVATTYRIDAVDNGEPGKGVDTFSIQTGTGYSRSGVLTGGNVQVQ